MNSICPGIPLTQLQAETSIHRNSNALTRRALELLAADYAHLSGKQSAEVVDKYIARAAEDFARG